MNKQNKIALSNDRITLARMIRDFGLYTAQDVFEHHLEQEEFIIPDKQYSLKYVSPFTRKGRRDSCSDGFDKPRVEVSAYFKKVLSLDDYRATYGINESLKNIEHIIHSNESEWHNSWKERVKDFCEIEKRFYPNNIPIKSGYKIADAYYERTNTVIEFQKSFDDEALTKCRFYSDKGIKLIWLFYLQTLSVFEDKGLYKIREDNYYHFFRIEKLMSNFYDNNVVFIQDKNNRIYHIKALGRAKTNTELEGTVRYFERSLSFNDSDDFARWIQYDWGNSNLFAKELKYKYKSLEDIFEPFINKQDKRFYLQNCEKLDINGNYLIYVFLKDDGLIRQNTHGYIGYRCYITDKGAYITNFKNKTNNNPKTKKWTLLKTNLGEFSDIVHIEKQ